MKTVNLELVKTALERVNGEDFEEFANAVFAAIIGPEFIPLGGRKDWGADALLCTVTYQKTPQVFYQFSVQEDFETKIRNTVKRLQEVGRTVTDLYYGTSQIIPRIDIKEQELGKELGITLRIRDGAYMAVQVNTTPATLAAYETHLAPSIAFLSDLHNTPLLAPDDANTNAAVYVFLRNEIESRDSGGSSEGLADGLIIWALRDTNSSENRFLTAQQIQEQIDKDVPGVTSVLAKTIPNRLRALSKIPQGLQRPIRYHADGAKYAIAFDIRTKMRDDNLQAESLRRAVFAVYRTRVLLHASNATEHHIQTASTVAFRTIQKCLEKEGIEFAAFLCGNTNEAAPLKASLEDCIQEAGISASERPRITATVESVLHEALSNPSSEERLLYSRIASVYTILFCLRTEPRLIEYFEHLAGHFHLIVGSDVLVRAIAERFEQPEQRLFCNTLQLVYAAGGTMVLTEPVLEEVQHHIMLANNEFSNEYCDTEEAITPDLVQYIKGPLIRSYFQGKLSSSPNRPTNWLQFLNNYCNPRSLGSPAAKEELRKYLMSHYHLTFLDWKQIKADTADCPVQALAEALSPYKKRMELALNDALMPHLVYAFRKNNKEDDDVSSYGLKTWWLTNETSITQHTLKLVKTHGAGYLMRPDYLLNFLSMLPKRQQVKALYNTLFPSLLGVHLARDFSPAHVTRLHEYLREIKACDPARRRVLVAQKSDQLKADLRSVSWSGWGNSTTRGEKSPPTSARPPSEGGL